MRKQSVPSTAMRQAPFPSTLLSSTRQRAHPSSTLHCASSIYHGKTSRNKMKSFSNASSPSVPGGHSRRGSTVPEKSSTCNLTGGQVDKTGHKCELSHSTLPDLIAQPNFTVRVSRRCGASLDSTSGILIMQGNKDRERLPSKDVPSASSNLPSHTVQLEEMM